MNIIVTKYISLQRRNRVIILSVALLGIVLSLLSVSIGLKKFIVADTVMMESILSLRGARVASAFISGAILSLSGVVMQTLLRNPLASPYTLGISNAAAFGAAIGILFFSNSVIPGVTVLTAFIGTLFGLGLILLISGIKSSGVETVILAGVVINSLFSAGIAIMQYVADSAQLATIVFWTFGDLGKGDWMAVLLLFITSLAAGFYLYRKRWDYKALELGDDYARSVGVQPVKIRLTGLIVASLMTAVAVSIFGVIAFVGLAVPHLLRRMVGADLNYLIPASLIFGGAFMVVCDMVSKLLFDPIIIPIGIITSIIGVPLFIIVLYKYYRR